MIFKARFGNCRERLTWHFGSWFLEVWGFIPHCYLGEYCCWWIWVAAFYCGWQSLGEVLALKALERHGTVHWISKVQCLKQWTKLEWRYWLTLSPQGSQEGQKPHVFLKNNSVFNRGGSAVLKRIALRLITPTTQVNQTVGTLHEQE